MKKVAVRKSRAVLSEKGQVTVPKKIRDSMGMRAGQLLEFSEDRDKVIIRKVNGSDFEEALHSVRGILRPLGKTTDELITELRGEPDAIDWNR